MPTPEELAHIKIDLLRLDCAITLRDEFVRGAWDCGAGASADYWRGGLSFVCGSQGGGGCGGEA